MPQRAVFLDRDGTINREASFLGRPSQLELEPAAPEGLKILQDAGFELIVVSNQSGVARGYFDEDAVKRVNKTLSRRLAKEGVRLERFYFCPHHPEGVVPEHARYCHCRKPQPGLLLKAAAEVGIDLKSSYSVGDSLRDLEAGRAAGTKAVLVMTGFGQEASREARPGAADYIARDLADAARWIVNDSGAAGTSNVNR